MKKTDARMIKSREYRNDDSPNRFPQLQELEAKLKKAYVLKALQAQIAEQRIDRLTKDTRTRVAEEIEYCRITADVAEREHQEIIQRTHNASSLKNALVQQSEARHREKIIRATEERLERELLVEVDRAREDRESAELKRDRDSLEEQLLLEDLLQREFREVARDQLKQRDEIETEANHRHLLKLEARSKALDALRKEGVARREETLQAVARGLLDSEQTVERRRLLVELMLEEVRLEAELEVHEMELQRQRETREQIASLLEQRRLEEEHRRLFIEREHRFAEEVMDRLMKSEAMERLTAEARRLRRLEHRHKLEELMAERSRARVEELEKTRRALEKERQREKLQLAEIQMARMELLKQHIDLVGEYVSEDALTEEERVIVEKSKNLKDNVIFKVS